MQLELELAARKTLQHELAESRQEMKAMKAAVQRRDQQHADEMQRRDQQHAALIVQKDIEIDCVRDSLEASTQENQSQLLRSLRLEVCKRREPCAAHCVSTIRKPDIAPGVTVGGANA